MLVMHSLSLLLQQSWVLLLLSLPFTGWILTARIKVAEGDFGVYDPTKINIRANLRSAIKESLVYMGYHMASFFVYMWILVSSIPDSDGSRPPLQQEVPW